MRSPVKAPSLSENLPQPVIDFGFKPKVKSRGDTLVSLWRAARSNAEKAPACPCHGIIAGRVDPDTLEINMLAPMRTRYREAGQKDLRDVVEKRLRKSPFAGMRQPFENWLQGLISVALSEDEKKILYDDLETSLQYHAETQVVFVCE
ncbi:MAG: hypothetical protein ACXWJ6_11875 [Xanthobacteraceae bacterium]